MEDNPVDDGEHDERQSSKRQARAAVRPFTPSRPAVVVRPNRILTLKADSVSPAIVGWKAFGLTCLPSEWVPPFFVVDGKSISGDTTALKKRIARCLSRFGLDGATVFVRSSGIEETIEHRGRLVSSTCPASEVTDTIQSLSAQLPVTDAGKVHWIVQRNITAVRKGHLSNERRLSYEPRDFVVEIQIENDRPGLITAIAVRHWRDGADAPQDPLACVTETAVTITLKRVALWATGLSSRMLFEWVWSGTRIWIVQADVAKTQGDNPASLIPRTLPSVSHEALSTFRLAQTADYDRYGKLRNARTYRQLNYDMPSFYLLNDQDSIQQILKGTLPQGIAADLAELTKRPLIIRTDGIDLPDDKRQMLPRSDELRSSAAAATWLTETLAQQVRQLGIAKNELCLIAHHFIPSVAAAWARAEPLSTIVRVESLWGVPEGLYWYSHDTFEVDTRLNKDGTHSFRERLRYKGTFVAPDGAGRWVNHQTAPSHDWIKSIQHRSWLFEIAETTKGIAQHDGHAVAVMWFVGNHQDATRHAVLPWYHLPSSLDAPKAAPRRKFTTSGEFKIETAAQWEEFRTLIESGKKVESVSLEPREPELVRNQEFARTLGEFCARHSVVIELAGAVLSHAYHLLRSAGAQVECIDLFGADEENVEYNKLVRDKIPETIRVKGEGVEVLHLKGEALILALRQKLVEEAFEAMDAEPGVELLAELADVEEVIRGICGALQVTIDQVESERERKRVRLGGFEEGVMLRGTSSPHSLRRREPESSPRLVQPIEQVVDQPTAMPETRQYRKPDLRNVDQQPEAQLTIETELNRKIRGERHPAVFEIPIDAGDNRIFTVIVELTRVRSSIRAKVRARLEPSQISMKLDDVT